MNQNLISLGLVVIGFTLFYLMPASMRKNWKEIGTKPPAGDAVLLLMRFMGLLTAAAGLVLMSGVVDLAKMAGNGP